MAKNITIQNRVIKFPESAEAPNWAPAIVEFAEAVEAALATVTGQFDVAPQVFNIDFYNGTGTTIPALNFPFTSVSRVSILYSVVRTTDTNTAVEGGTIDLLYDQTKTVGNNWDLVVTRQGDGLIDFSIDNAGQMSFTTQLIAGSNYTGFISFRASAILNS